MEISPLAPVNEICLGRHGFSTGVFTNDYIAGLRKATIMLEVSRVVALIATSMEQKKTDAQKIGEAVFLKIDRRKNRVSEFLACG